MWIYLSPHPDDAALSVGGLIWEQAHSGEEAAVWTICAGDPPAGDLSPFAVELHARWGTDSAMPVRRAEDIESCHQLGTAYHHFPIPDCIYRRSPVTGKHLYDSEAALWSPVHPDEANLVTSVAAALRRNLPAGAQVAAPLGLGNHVDHRLTRAAAEQLGVPLWYYADYPYVLQAEQHARLAGRPFQVKPVSPAGLRAWKAAIAAHQSQIGTFWADLTEMREAIRAYSRQMGGVRLYLSGSPHPT